MNCPPVRPLLGAMLGLVLGAASASSAPVATKDDPPAPAKPGWVSRVAAAPKKLAFWDKEKKQPPLAEPASPPPAKTVAAKPKPAPAVKPGAAASAAAKPAATKKIAPAAAPAEEAPPPKKSFLSNLPALPPMSRLWPSAKKPGPEEDSAPVASAKPVPGKRTAVEPVAVDPGPATTPKPSLWARVTAAVTPAAGASPKAETTPVPKGLAPLGAPAPAGTSFVITKDDSAFYSFGPQQATPPDAYLSTGTVVTLTGKTWGWATVQLPDGRTGVVDRGALRPALMSDLIPSQRLGEAGSLMAALSPNQLKRQSSPSFILPAAEMPDLPTGADSGGPAGNPLLLPFSPDDISDPGNLPPLPEIPPLPEPSAPAEPGQESPPASGETPPATAEPAEPSPPAPPAASPESPATPAAEPSAPAE